MKNTLGSNSTRSKNRVMRQVNFLQNFKIMYSFVLSYDSQIAHDFSINNVICKSVPS